MKNYTIINKSSKLHFGGFNKDHSVKWVGRDSAISYSDIHSARAQSILLSKIDSSVQIKPVTA